MRLRVTPLTHGQWRAGLLAVLAQLPSMAAHSVNGPVPEELARGALVPISGLIELIRNHHGHIRLRLGGGAL